jgi:hypothetical protein
MTPFVRVLAISAVLVSLTATSAQAQRCRGRHCGPGYGCGVPSCPPYWCDPYADLRPWPDDNPLYEGPRNWAWWYPHGGFTAYPGLPGSGIVTGSDYSHVNWVVSPTVNAQMVTQKLRAMGVPLVPQDTIYLGKNPKVVEKAKLPMPKNWIKDDEPEKDKDLNKDQ